MKSKSITLLKAIAQKGQETVPYLNPNAVCPFTKLGCTTDEDRS